tara:strand:+ start:1830 stop:2192 length:363 start_codon:yes stop_codon:yes gene_type:complete
MTKIKNKEAGVVYKDKKGKVISKGEAMKAFDKADAAERRDKSKLPKSKPKVGSRISDIFKSYGKATKGVMTLSDGGESTIKSVAAKLKKASKAHAGQAKALENVVKKKGGGLMDYYKDIL